jgi:hypothetical protein
VLAGGRRANPNKFRDAVRYQVIKADPEAAEQRRNNARCHRNVTFTPTNDSMGQLTARLTADETIAAYRRITMLARRAKTPERTLAQCRADILMSLILGNKAEHVQAQLNVTVPMTTLMGLNQHPGEIAGYGPITADHVRELAQNAIWRRIITDPTGQVQEISPRRYRSPFLGDHIRTRARTCRVAGCELPAEETPMERGAAGIENTIPLCQCPARMQKAG